MLSLVFAAPALALAAVDSDASARILRTWTLHVRELATRQATQPTHRLRLEMAVQLGTRWEPGVILAATRRAAAILAQCGVQTIAYLHEFAGPHRYRDLSSPVSRELARKIGLRKPAIFFVDDTLHRPAFDAEAIGRSNSATRPEMTDTVWITSATRDLPIALAHELVHVLTDSGAHSNAVDNLMREDTAAGNTHLTAEQCASTRTMGAANGLLERTGGNEPAVDALN